jgi:hypothetical protein
LNDVQCGLALAIVKTGARDVCDGNRIAVHVLGIFPFHASPPVDRAQGGQGEGGGFVEFNISLSSTASPRDLHLETFGDERLGVIQVQVALKGQGDGLAYEKSEGVPSSCLPDGL